MHCCINNWPTYYHKVSSNPAHSYPIVKLAYLIFSPTQHKYNIQILIYPIMSLIYLF
jgi:hypothetical protein